MRVTGALLVAKATGPPNSPKASFWCLWRKPAVVGPFPVGVSGAQPLLSVSEVALSVAPRPGFRLRLRLRQDR
jgi:hypothetical protein